MTKPVGEVAASTTVEEPVSSVTSSTGFPTSAVTSSFGDVASSVEDPASSVESTCLDQVNLTGKAPPNPDTDPDDSSVDPAHVPLPPKSDRSVSRQPVYDEPRKLSGGSSRGGNLDCETVVVSVFKIVEPR